MLPLSPVLLHALKRARWDFMSLMTLNSFISGSKVKELLRNPGDLSSIPRSYIKGKETVGITRLFCDLYMCVVGAYVPTCISYTQTNNFLRVCLHGLVLGRET